MYSLTIREIFRRFHGVEVGLYTLGPCEAEPDRLGDETIIGRYSSIYWTARATIRHSSANSQLFAGLEGSFGLQVEGGKANSSPRLVIGNDVFVGHNAIILPSVEVIGDGAFIGAGSVVQTNVPPYAVVAGNPARVVRYRFSEGKIRELLESKWWLKTIDELGQALDEFQKPVEGDAIR